jgi:hypothetical protein
MQWAAVDIQGFQGLVVHQKMTPKEVGIKLSDGSQHVYYVKPCVAFPFLSERQQRVVHWGVLKHHALSYSGGSVTLKELELELQRLATGCAKIYTKGHHKREYLEEVLGREIVDLTTLGCPPMNGTNSDSCKAHFKPGMRCAVAGADFLADWLKKKQDGDTRSTTTSAETQSSGKEEIHGGRLCSQQDTEESKETGSICN